MAAAYRRPHVALLIGTLYIDAYDQRILRGINRYLRSHQPWSIYADMYRQLRDEAPRWISSWHGDGIIYRSVRPRFAERLRELKIPLVNLSDHWTNADLPLIRSDDYAIGRLAAEHFLERGFRRFAFCGYNDTVWSQRRREGFAAAVQQQGEWCGVYESPWDGFHSHHRGEQEYEAMGHWLASLPQPLAVLACNDARGYQVLETCWRINAAVPDEIAVLGVDDDELCCSVCRPPLSSVRPDPERIGYEAAALLDRLMQRCGTKGKNEDECEEILIEPLGVTTRQSTDVLALDDRNLATAVRCIREHACQGITVPELLKSVPLRRIELERLFRKYLGHSPQAEIRAVQLKRVKQLLAETDLSLEQIAALAGYKHPEYMSVVFKRLTGQTPGHYRQQTRYHGRDHNGAVEEEETGRKRKSHPRRDRKGAV
jgi:LacI family transcriptional regulator